LVRHCTLNTRTFLPLDFTILDLQSHLKWTIHPHFVGTIWPPPEHVETVYPSAQRTQMALFVTSNTKFLSRVTTASGQNRLFHTEVYRVQRYILELLFFVCVIIN
jgi:hypothetical protein